MQLKNESTPQHYKNMEHHNIPKTHPRFESLMIRQRLVTGFDMGIVAKEGLLAHGRGEAFDYILGEKTRGFALAAIKAAAAHLLMAKAPVVSINGNVAALCPQEMVNLAASIDATLEVNLFYDSIYRRRAIADVLYEYGATKVLGADTTRHVRLPHIESARSLVDKDGIATADVVVVPLEDGDRTIALKKAGKIVVTFDLNPMSRTAIDADITIVDNVVRASRVLATECNKIKDKKNSELRRIIKNFDNAANLAQSVKYIRDALFGKEN